MSDLTQYKEAVNDYAAKRVNYLFHNEGDEHALVIFASIFSNAKKTIRIAANKLCNNEVANREEYVKSLSSFLDKKDTKLFIILTNRPEKKEVADQGCLYRMLFNHSAYKENRICIKEGKGKCFRDSQGKVVHICMGDDVMYRIEQDIVARKAVANFGDSMKTQMLNNKFDEIFNSNEVSLVDLKDYYDSI